MNERYRRKFKRFVQGMISEDDFRTYLMLSHSKKDLVDIIFQGALNLRRAVSIGELIESKTSKVSGSLR